MKALLRAPASWLRPWLEAAWPHPRERLLDGHAWRPEAADACCPRCGVSRGAAPDCPHCAGRRPPWRRVVRLGPWTEPLTALVAHAKYRGAWSLLTWLAPPLAARLEGAPGPDTLVVPVPMHWRRRVERGYNQAELLARAVAEARGWTCAPAVLRRTRATARQSALGQGGRAHNLRGAFAPGRAAAQVRGRRVVLVDDVLTTGATARACARWLRRLGAAEVQLAVLAVADPPGWTRREAPDGAAPPAEG